MFLLSTTGLSTSDIHYFVIVAAFCGDSHASCIACGCRLRCQPLWAIGCISPVKYNLRIICAAACSRRYLAAQSIDRVTLVIRHHRWILLDVNGDSLFGVNRASPIRPRGGIPITTTWISAKHARGLMTYTDDTKSDDHVSRTRKSATITTYSYKKDDNFVFHNNISTVRHLHVSRFAEFHAAVIGISPRGASPMCLDPPF